MIDKADSGSASDKSDRDIVTRATTATMEGDANPSTQSNHATLRQCEMLASESKSIIAMYTM